MSLSKEAFKKKLAATLAEPRKICHLPKKVQELLETSEATVEMMKMLITMRFYFNTPINYESFGVTLFSLALDYGDDQMIETLRDAGAKLPQKNLFTPLYKYQENFVKT